MQDRARRSLVLGTAGHVDHGKTTLVHALTGVDTDRLKEERERGITIELGFAHLDLDGRRLSVIDVPGHERFVKAMAAGASGIDLLLLVVAADEGVMPQTREHLNICTLLGVQRGLVVVTKADLVDEEWLELVDADLDEGLAGTFLEGAPRVRFSSTAEPLRSEGLAALRSELSQLAEHVEARSNEGPFRLPVDRVFVMKGFGTVATGTALSGTIQSGDKVEVRPSGRTSRVRSLQVHGVERPEGGAGQRVALNLLGLEQRELHRGDTIVRAGELRACALMDVHVHLLEHGEKALARRSHLQVHHAAAQVEATVQLLDRELLEPGDWGLAQLRLAHPLVACRGDRFILRGFSRDGRYGATLGGGEVLVPRARRHRGRRRGQTLEGLNSIRGGGDDELLLHLLRERGAPGLTLRALAELANLRSATVEGRVRALEGRNALVSAGGELLAVERARDLLSKLQACLRDHHQRHPRAQGAQREELLSLLPELANARGVGRALLEHWVAQASLRRVGDRYALPGFQATRDPQVEARKDRLVTLLREGRYTPPKPGALAESLSRPGGEVSALLRELEAEGRLTRVKDELFLESERLNELREALVAFLTRQGAISPTEFKALVGGSRRYAIPLAEYFDRTRLTLRVGDLRKLRGR